MLLLKKLLPEAKIHPIGSRYVCNPPVMDTDIDFLVYSEPYDIMWAVRLISQGYVRTTDLDKYVNPENNFTTWRRGVVNLVVTENVDFAEGFQTATYLCKKHNIWQKSARILIHAAFRENQYFPASISICHVPAEVKALLESFNGPHGHAIHKAYRAKHGLVL